ncbi:DUF1656 domain-containing protein [Brucella pseudogrignonensis]|uniref:DUF1656 domain-containing protein n=1 Tax=Brucella pseudogrignonensis TaxID=419475 RepID=UPI00286C4DEF|nr:DUF1656 domain-containing protein [Brucella pseudogrignonensis]
MNAELDVYGVFIPSIAALGLVAFCTFRIVLSILSRSGFYQLVWHPSLFNFALYITILGGLSTILHWY